MDKDQLWLGYHIRGQSIGRTLGERDFVSTKDFAKCAGLRFINHWIQVTLSPSGHYRPEILHDTNSDKSFCWRFGTIWAATPGARRSHPKPMPRPGINVHCRHLVRPQHPECIDGFDVLWRDEPDLTRAKATVESWTNLRRKPGEASSGCGRKGIGASVRKPFARE
jgi:hypothetical protein